MCGNHSLSTRVVWQEEESGGEGKDEGRQGRVEREDNDCYGLS